MNKLNPKFKEIINYIIFGVLTTVVNIVVYYVAADVFHIHYLVSNGLAWLLSVLFAYITNKLFVFESKSTKILSEMGKFFGARIATGILDTILMWVLITVLSMNGLLSKIIVNVVVIVSNYVISKLYVFKKGE